MLLTTTIEELGRFRRLLEGQTQAALSVEGYAGLSLPAKTSIKTPWGTLLPAEGRARRISTTEVETPVLLLSGGPGSVPHREIETLHPSTSIELYGKRANAR